MTHDLIRLAGVIAAALCAIVWTVQAYATKCAICVRPFGIFPGDRCRRCLRAARLAGRL